MKVESIPQFPKLPLFHVDLTLFTGKICSHPNLQRLTIFSQVNHSRPSHSLPALRLFPFPSNSFAAPEMWPWHLLPVPAVPWQLVEDLSVSNHLVTNFPVCICTLWRKEVLDQHPHYESVNAARKWGTTEIDGTPWISSRVLYVVEASTGTPGMQGIRSTGGR